MQSNESVSKQKKIATERRTEFHSVSGARAAKPPMWSAPARRSFFGSVTGVRQKSAVEPAHSRNISSGSAHGVKLRATFLSPDIASMLLLKEFTDGFSSEIGQVEWSA